MVDVLVVGAGPAGAFAALRAADLGARTTLVTSEAFGGMAGNDGPIPVRTLAHAARLLRNSAQLADYGIGIGDSAFSYSRLIERVGLVVEEARNHSTLRAQLDSAGVLIHEQAGRAHFVTGTTMETDAGLSLPADRIIICTGGKSRRLPIPGFELTATHSDVWALQSVPKSILVLGAGATGVQVASIFAAFGAEIQLFQGAPRILPTEDEEVSAAVASAFRARGIRIVEGFGQVDSFERTETGVRMTFCGEHGAGQAEAQLIVSAVGWCADAEALRLDMAGVDTDTRGHIAVDEFGRTSTPHIYAAGDVTGGAMLVTQAMHCGFVAASAALGQPSGSIPRHLVPVGSFTDPEYAHVGLTEAAAEERYDILVVKVPYADMTRAVIDGRTFGFCKLVVDRRTGEILGCHIVGERAVDTVQLAALAMASDMTVAELARLPMSFPIYSGILLRAAIASAYRLNHHEVRQPAVALHTEF